MDWEALQKLFPLYRLGDLNATETLFRGIQKALAGYYYARLSKRDEAEDLAQAALLKIHFSRDRYDLKQSLKTWVFTIASRTLIDHWRGFAVESKYQDANPEEAIDLTESLLLDPERKTEFNHDLNEALKTLKPIDRSIVYLFGVEGFSMSEIAKIHGLTEAAIKVRAHRANHALRAALGGSNGSD
jgi:RNA polymerase sigma-70 factor (ECF subfamily)